MTTSRIVVGEQERKGAPRPEPERALVVGVVVIVGLALASLIDFGMLWFPLRLGNLDWEFATIAATADSLPLLTLAAAGLLAIALWRGRRVTVGVLGAGFGLACLLVLALLVVHLLNAPIALRAVSQETRPIVVKAIGKTGALLGLYLALYAALSWTALRSLRRRS